MSLYFLPLDTHFGVATVPQLPTLALKRQTTYCPLKKKKKKDYYSGGTLQPPQLGADLASSTDLLLRPVYIVNNMTSCIKGSHWSDWTLWDNSNTLWILDHGNSTSMMRTIWCNPLRDTVARTKPPCGVTLTPVGCASVCQWLTVVVVVVVWVWVCEGGDADKDLAAVSQDHQLQLPPWLLYQLPGVVQREVLRHRPIDLHTCAYAHTNTHTVQTVRGCIKERGPDWGANWSALETLRNFASFTFLLKAVKGRMHTYMHIYIHTSVAGCAGLLWRPKHNYKVIAIL